MNVTKSQHNRFAVAVLEKGTDHEIGRKCLKMDGIIDVEVTGKCQGSGLPKGWRCVVGNLNYTSILGFLGSWFFF